MKFKVNDWVRHKRLRTTHRCTYVNGGEFDNKISTIPSLSFDSEYMCDYELWQPKEGEWCWYKNNLVKIIDITDSIYVKAKPASFMDRFVFFADFVDCEPFIGKLPSSIKDTE